MNTPNKKRVEEKEELVNSRSKRANRNNRKIIEDSDEEY